MALTSKERKALRSMANTLEATLIVGKDNVNDGVAAHAGELLDQHELVKGSVLETSELTARQAADLLAEACGADCVQVIGRKFVLFRPSPRDDVAHIQFGPDGEARVMPAPKPAKKRSPKKGKRPVKPRSAIKARLAREQRAEAAGGMRRTFRPVARQARPADDGPAEGGRRPSTAGRAQGGPSAPRRTDGRGQQGRPSHGGPSAQGRGGAQGRRGSSRRPGDRGGRSGR